MKYDYVALVDQPRHGPYWNDLVDEGWCEWMKIPFWTPARQCGPKPSYIYVMRRVKEEPCGEPRIYARQGHIIANALRKAREATEEPVEPCKQTLRCSINLFG